MGCWAGRGPLAELRRETAGVFAGLECAGSSLRWRWDPSPGETKPDWRNCCWAKAKSEGFWGARRAMSELPRVTSATGGPRELSMPWPLCEAGGRRVLGERASGPVVAGWGEKYEGEVAVEAEKGAVGVEGFVWRRGRDDVEGAVEAPEGRRRSWGGSGRVEVRRCLVGGGCEGWRAWCCCEASLDDLRE